MKPLIITLLASFLLAATHAFAQTPPNRPLVGDKSPQDPIPGLIVRVHLGNGKTPKAEATHLLCVVQNGKEWFDKFKPMAADELRGKTKNAELNYYAFGFIIVDKDTEVVFEMDDSICRVSGKEFGQGTYRQPFKKGKYPIEIYRHYGHGQHGFEITGASGEQVLFYTGEMHTRELARNEKVEKKTYKTKMIGDAGEPKR